MKRVKRCDAAGVLYLCTGQVAKLGLCLAVVTLSMACSDTSPEKAVTAPVAGQTLIAPLAQSSQNESRGGDPVAAFHAKNYADWVGQAHNKAMDDFFSRLNDKTRGAPINLCAEILEFASDPARVPAGRGATTRELRRTAAARALSATGVCGGQFTDARSGNLSLTSAHRNASQTGSGTLSAAANSLITQIKSASVSATTASALATMLTPILSQADQLTISGERDIVYSVASVAQSSYEYWTANLQPQAYQTQSTYGGCLVQYSDQGVALSTCMGISGVPILPTLYSKPVNPGVLLFAGSMQSGCDSNLNKGNVVLWDAAGAVGGALVGWLAGPPGIASAALAGGLGASATEGTYQLGSWAWCKVRGGGGGAPKPIQKT
jgi:hypothetical protein